MASTQTPRDAAAPGDARLAAAWEAIGRPDVKVVSTDVFDTLLWRQAAEPADVFVLVGERLRRRGQLASRLEPEAFRTLRGHAEHQARVARAHACNDLEVTLEEIYARMPDWMFTPTGRAVGIDTELAVEHEVLVADLDVLALLVAAKAAGKQVVAVSDTYFSAAQLRELLDQPGLDALEVDRVFSSSEHRRSKADGLLGVMLEAMGVGGEAVVHLGDNPAADHAPAEKLGIAPIAFDRHPEELADLLEAERRFADRPPHSAEVAKVQPELTSLRGKVAARAELTRLPPALQPFWKIGALVLGPVMTGFGEWVQENAAERRLSRVFCFMREGELLVDVVNRAGASMGSPVRAEKLWLNRETLAAAAIGDVSRAELGALLVRRRTPTVAALLRTIGLAVSDLPGFASHAATRLDDPTVRENLFAALQDDEALRARVMDHARAQRERVVAYVEGLLEEGEDLMGVVDLGWGGSAQRLLERVLHAAGRRAGIVGLYLLTHEGVAASGTNARGYLGEFGAPERAAETIVRTPEILEQLCMPDHGPQVGLDADLQPILAPAAHDRLQMVEAAALRQGAESFQREWARYRVAMPGKLPSLSRGAHVLRPLLLRQLQAPTPVEATLLGGWAHDENQGSDRSEEIADLRHAGRLRYLSPSQLQQLRMEELYWPAGVAARADALTAQLYAAAAAGQVPWEALGSPVESGQFVVRAEGTDVDLATALRSVPTRNRLGLSEVSGTITAPAIAELVIQPSEGPAVVRFDHLHLRCHVQGRDEPLTAELEGPEDFLRLKRSYCYLLNANVFVAHSHSPELRLDLRELTSRTIFRVDVRVGFAILPISELLPAIGRLRSVEEAGHRVEELEAALVDKEELNRALRSEMDQVYGSLRWRITKPLRLLKRLSR